MAGEVLPEVAAREAVERQAREAERLKQAELLAAGKGPSKPVLPSDSDDEPEPDARIQVPANKVKYVVGPGGAKIQDIQRRSKARIQIQKDQEELTRGWGTTGLAAAAKAQAEAAMARMAAQRAAAERGAAKATKAAAKLSKAAGAAEGGYAEGADGGGADDAANNDASSNGSSSSEEDNAAAAPGAPPRKMTTLLLYGDAKAIEVAERMIQEAVANKAQKAKQHEKQYAKKREEKWRNRQLYYLRHTKDYEALEVPVGTPKADLKKAFRRLAVLWHPDKHPNNQEEAKARFQAIQVAYDRLMSSNEEDRVEALAAS